MACWGWRDRFGIDRLAESLELPGSRLKTFKRCAKGAQARQALDPKHQKPTAAITAISEDRPEKFMAQRAMEQGADRFSRGRSSFTVIPSQNNDLFTAAGSTSRKDRKQEP